VLQAVIHLVRDPDCAIREDRDARRARELACSFSLASELQLHRAGSAVLHDLVGKEVCHIDIPCGVARDVGGVLQLSTSAAQ